MIGEKTPRLCLETPVVILFPRSAPRVGVERTFNGKVIL